MASLFPRIERKIVLKLQMVASLKWKRLILKLNHSLLQIEKVNIAEEYGTIYQQNMVSFHFFNTLYYICRAVTYSFTITYLEYFRTGNFRLKVSIICTIYAKFKQYNF